MPADVAGGLAAIQIDVGQEQLVTAHLLKKYTVLIDRRVDALDVEVFSFSGGIIECQPFERTYFGYVSQEC